MALRIFFLLVMWLAASFELAAFGQAPAAPPKLTAEQEKQLAERDRHEKDANRLRGEGKLAECRALVEKCLRLERQVFGEVHQEVAGSLAWLADLCTKLEDFPAAREHAQKALGIHIQLRGETHWKTIDARLKLADVILWAELSKEQRADLDKAGRFNLEGKQLLNRGEYAKAKALFQEALRIRGEIQGKKHQYYALSLYNLAVLYEWQREYAKAAPLYREALEIRKQVLGDKHPDYATSLNDLAALYKAQEEYAKAAPLYREALEIRKQALGDKHPDYATSLNSLAGLYKAQEEYAKAEPLYLEALEIRKQAQGEKHPDYATSLNNLAGLYKSQGEYAKSELLYRQALEIRRQIQGEKHPEYAANLRGLAMLYDTQKEYAKAEPLYRQALAIRKQVQGEKHSDYLTSLNDLAGFYYSQGEYAKAEPLYRQALAITKQALGDKHPNYATSLNSLAGLYKAQEEYAKAEPLYLEALEIRKQALGDKHPDYASSLNNLAALYDSRGEYVKAGPLYRQSLEIRKQAQGEKHPDYATSLNNLAGLYKSQGEYAKSELLYRQALEIRRQIQGEKHPDYATSLNNLAGLYKSQGEYAKAGPLYLQALEIRKQAQGEKHHHYAIGLSNLAELYRLQGEYAKAEPLNRQALEITKQALGEQHPAYATSLNNLAVLCKWQGQYAEAEQLHRQALEIHKRMLGEKHPSYATSLNNLAALYGWQGKYAQAEPLYLQALEIHKQALGEKHPDYATSLNNLAGNYKLQREFAKAEPLHLQALEIRKQALGEKHPEYALSLLHLAMLYRAQGEYARAGPVLAKALDIIERHLEQTAAAQTETGQLAYAADSRDYLDELLVLKGVDVATVYASVFRWRGAVSARQAFARAARTTDPAVRQTVEQLHDVSLRLSNLVARMSAPNQRGLPTDALRLIQKLNEQREALEKKLASQSQDFARYEANRQLTPAELQKLLPPDAILVDFLAFGNKMAAFIVSGDNISRVDLMGGKELAQLVEAFRSEQSLSQKRPAKEAETENEDIRKVVWDPLAPYLRSAKLVLLCPDGPLCQLPFAALRGSDPNKYLIEEMALAVVPVPRLLPELLADRRNALSGPASLLLVGDVDFNANTEMGAPLIVTAKTRGKGVDWDPLPGTKLELEAIAKLFAEHAKGAEVKPLSRKDATATAVRRAAGNYRYLHLATHGQFLKQNVGARLDPSDRELSVVQQARDRGVSGGVLSRLVLAGANAPTLDDAGVLSAMEIAEMDLRGVELAVLSACETGLGDVRGGEGVLGLQRAFLFAGARTTVTSLWQIPDGATTPLMVRFYANRLKGLGALESLREAQLWALNNGVETGVLTERPSNGRRTPPLYWAAFVLAGDWR